VRGTFFVRKLLAGKMFDGGWSSKKGGPIGRKWSPSKRKGVAIAGFLPRAGGGYTPLTQHNDDSGRRRKEGGYEVGGRCGAIISATIRRWPDWRREGEG